MGIWDVDQTLLPFPKDSNWTLQQKSWWVRVDQKSRKCLNRSKTIIQALPWCYFDRCWPIAYIACMELHPKYKLESMLCTTNFIFGPRARLSQNRTIYKSTSTMVACKRSHCHTWTHINPVVRWVPRRVSINDYNNQDRTGFNIHATYYIKFTDTFQHQSTNQSYYKTSSLDKAEANWVWK